MPGGSKFVPPFAQCIAPDSATLTNNIVGTTYGEQEGHLVVYDIFVDNGDRHVDVGETIGIWPSFLNDGSLAINNGLSARLILPDEFERDNCMEILTDTADYQGTVLCIGNGGCEFSMKNADGTPDKSAHPKNNIYQDNVLTLAKNSLEYLKTR